MSNLKKDGKQRWSPSYLRRQGQATPRQKRAIREHWDQYGLEFSYGKKIDLASAFESPDHLILEIGFGMGDHLIHLAKENPGASILGIEVHKPGIGGVIAELMEQAIDNVRIIRGDARLVMTDHLDGRCFDQVHIQCPDPWPKPEDAHRRLVQTDFILLLEKRMRPDGILHTITDVACYAEHISDVMANQENWKSCPTLPDRLRTRYEQKGLDHNRDIHEQSYRLLR